MSLETIAARYAQAIYEIGTEAGNLPALADQMRRLGDVYAGSAELRSVLDNPLVPEASRDAVLAEIATRLGVDTIARNTVRMLAQRNRLVLLPYIARALDRLSDQRAGVLRAVVTTATAMPETYYAKVKEQLERSTGQKIVLDRAVDPQLLGGVVTRIGDRIIDGSLRSRLASMREDLLTT